MADRPGGVGQEPPQEEAGGIIPAVASMPATTRRTFAAGRRPPAACTPHRPPSSARSTRPARARALGPSRTRGSDRRTEAQARVSFGLPSGPSCVFGYRRRNPCSPTSEGYFYHPGLLTAPVDSESGLSARGHPGASHQGWMPRWVSLARRTPVGPRRGFEVARDKLPSGNGPRWRPRHPRVRRVAEIRESQQRRLAVVIEM